MANPLAGLASPQRLLIIAPDAFLAAVQPLVAHKNATGMPATAVSISSLKSFFGAAMPGQPAPADDAEMIKRAIQYAHENLGSAYVLLVGDGANLPTRFWFLWNLTVSGYTGGVTPKYANGQTIPCDPMGTYIQSDLYYASLYHHSGSYPNLTPDGFDNWNKSGAGLYNQAWMDNTDLISPPTLNTARNPDGVDGYPDVAVGRLPAASAAEATSYVAKVIQYETAHAGPSPPSMNFVHDKQYGFLNFTTGLSQTLTQAGWAPEAIKYYLIENYPNALSLANFGGKLFAAYIAADGSGDLLITSTDASLKWSSFAKTGQTSVTGPAVIPFGDSTLWMAFVAYSTGGSGPITLSNWTEGGKWSNPITTAFSSKETPALAVMGSSLYMGFVTDDDTDQIYVAVSESGKSWSSPPAPVPGQNSCAAPALAAFQPPGAASASLFMAFVTNDVTNKIYICSSANGQTDWSTINQVTDQVSAAAPALAVFDNKLYLAYTVADTLDLFVCWSADGVNWPAANRVQVPNQNSKGTPSLTVFDNKLFVGFIGNTTTTLYTCSLAPGAGQSWSGHTALPHTSTLAPAPFVSTSAAEFAATAANGFWISYIGHGGNGGWGHIETISEAAVMQTQNSSALPIAFAAACQTSLFVENMPWSGSFTVDSNGNRRGAFSVNPQAVPGQPGLVISEASPSPLQWGTGPGFTQPQPPGATQGSWALPVKTPAPNVYITSIDCVGKTWVIGASPGGAIAYFGVHDVAPPNSDIELEQNLLTNYLHAASNVVQLADHPGGGRPVLGDLYLGAQQTYWNAHQADATTAGSGDYHPIPRLYLGWLVLFGDPSLRLPIISTETLGGPILNNPLTKGVVIEQPGGLTITLPGDAPGGPVVVDDQHGITGEQTGGTTNKD